MTTRPAGLSSIVMSKNTLFVIFGPAAAACPARKTRAARMRRAMTDGADTWSGSRNPCVGPKSALAPSQTGRLRDSARVTGECLSSCSARATPLCHRSDRCWPTRSRSLRRSHAARRHASRCRRQPHGRAGRSLAGSPPPSSTLHRMMLHTQTQSTSRVTHLHPARLM